MLGKDEKKAVLRLKILSIVVLVSFGQIGQRNHTLPARQTDSTSVRAFQFHHFTARALDVDVCHLIAVAFECDHGFGFGVDVCR